MDVRRPRCLELGLFLVVVAVPLAFTPFSDSPFADPKILLLVAGTLLVWLGGVPVDRRLAVAATAWVAVTAVACVAGVDPTAGLLRRSPEEAAAWCSRRAALRWWSAAPAFRRC